VWLRCMRFGVLMRLHDESGRLLRGVVLSGFEPLNVRPPRPDWMESNMSRCIRATLLRTGLTLAVGVALLGGAQACSSASPAASAPAAADPNFGFPLGFSVEKLDRTADPRRDFRRYAAGRWLDAARIPADGVRISSFELLNAQVERQLGAILEEAARTSAAALPGSPRQQVGDLYASGMDTERLAALGVAPLQPELDRIAAIDGPPALAPALAHLLEITGEPVVAAFGVSSDLQDRSRYAVYLIDGELPMGRDNYLESGAAAIREGYVKKVAASLALAGTPPAEATAIAGKILEMETRVARKKLPPAEQRDPGRRFARMPFAEARGRFPHIDLDAFLRALGLPPQDEVIVGEAEALRERDAMLAEYPLADTKNYLRWELLRRTSPYLGPAFLEVDLAFARVLYGDIEAPPRAKLVGTTVATKMGHPLSQVYVEKHFPPATRRAVEELVASIRSEFRARLERNAWLSAATRAYALDKLDRAVIAVGYPTEWIDYTPVAIRRDDYLGNILRINTFATRRELSRLGGPVVQDGFSMAGSTLPIDINAAFNPARNGIEIPAAFLQPPFYDPAADVAVNSCTIGAVIGHEITHGFDTVGRLYDAAGNVRDWWAAADGEAFVAETRKLVAQADAFEVSPGVRLNGELTVTENLADVGGLALGYGALQRHLREHPEADRAIDGFTPEQRCFLAWAQLWADKANEGYLRQVAATDAHPNGIYRMVAPAQHEAGFFAAFGVEPGDPLWLEPARRVAIW
jgi:putative endopeptidase